MDLSWLHGWSLHSLLIKNLELPKYFHVGVFPPMKIVDRNDVGFAWYNHKKHDISFCQSRLMHLLDAFDHAYFHELMHSTSKFNKRWFRFCGHAGKTSSFDTEGYINLEERIADISSFILLKVYTNWSEPETLKERLVENYQTKFALPWGEVEYAVKYYLKDKNCPKIEMALQYYKQVTSEVTTVYEGQFNGQLQVKPKTTRTAGIDGINAGSIPI